MTDDALVIDNPGMPAKPGPSFACDVYRLAGSDEDLGWDELFYGDAITVIEWAHLIADDLPTNRLEINLAHGGDDTRIITVTPFGERYEKICEGLFL